MTIKYVLILSLLFNTIAYADEAEQEELLQKYAVSPESEVIVRLRDRNNELTETNRHLVSANSGLIQANEQLEKESSGVGFGWVVIGILAGGAAGYFGARSIK